MPEKYKQIKKLDRLDNVLLYLISCGGGSLSFLCNVLDEQESTLSDRVKRLTELNLTDSVDNREKYRYRKYVLTLQGEAFVASLDILSNLLLLKSGKLSDSSR